MGQTTFNPAWLDTHTHEAQEHAQAALEAILAGRWERAEMCLQGALSSVQGVKTWEAIRDDQERAARLAANREADAARAAYSAAYAAATASHRVAS